MIKTMTGEKLIEALVKKVEDATGEEVVAVYGHTRVKEILRAQHSQSGIWRIVKKTNNGSGGWRMFGGSHGYTTKAEADAKIAKLVEMFPDQYMEG